MATAPFDRTPVDDPAAHGIDAEALTVLCERVQSEIDARRLPSAQLALARDGKVVAWRAFGNAPVGSRYVIFSATKPVVASAVWILIGEGLLDVARTVASLVPEFASNGKGAITVEQVLLHTSG